MKKRLLFYIFYAIILLSILYLSFIIYFGNAEEAALFFLLRRGNVILIILTALFLSNLFDLISFRRERKKETIFLNEIIKVVGKVFIIILITSFLEFFVFFTTKLGRVVYVNYFFLLCLFLILEHIFISYLINKKKERLLWLSTISHEQVEKDYSLKLYEKEIYKWSNNPPLDYDYSIYDYPPRDFSNVNSLMHTVIAIKNPVDLITYVEETTEKIPLKYVDELWLIKNIRTYESVYDKLKKILSAFTCILLLFILFPVSFIIALIHKLESKGPLFFIQTRTGYRGKEFKLIKFRTMIRDAEPDGPQFAEINDPRVTSVGKFMRRCRIDEVPQLLNVLRGDMNLIGPRPERREFIEMLEKEIPFYKLRLEIRPGLSGWAQVNAPYAGNNTEEHLRKLEYDLYYIKNRSLPLDFIILFQTIKTMLTSGGT